MRLTSLIVFEIESEISSMNPKQRYRGGWGIAYDRLYGRRVRRAAAVSCIDQSHSLEYSNVIARTPSASEANDEKIQFVWKFV